ncbi:MAG: hypothetical protein VXX01_04515, partial [Pseudomonadota bacterium]|nr:hypothetical protein [Pseudomonadota bacterium]
MSGYLVAGYILSLRADLIRRKAQGESLRFVTLCLYCADPECVAPMFGSRPSEFPQRLGFILTDQFSMMAFASAIETLRMANRLSDK